MTNLLARRVAGFGTSIFSEITALALQHSAVNLGQGFPDFAGPDFLKQAAIDAITADLNQYAASPGQPRLRQAIASQWERMYGRAIDPQLEVTITSGATEALCDAALALLDPGDKAIVFEPAYDSYIPDITMAGATPIYVRLNPPHPAQGALSWWFDQQDLQAAFAQHPKVIFLNTPHNPTGKVFTKEELQLIAQLCQQYNVLAISDEVYEQLTYAGSTHIPLATLPGMWERTLTINSVGKTFSVTGWKIGYTVGPAELNHALRQAHQWVTFASATPFQEAAALAMEQAPHNGYYQLLQQEYAERLQLLLQLLERAGLPTLPVEGSYFIMADIGALGFDDDRSFCRMLTSEIGVAAIPTSAFYHDATTAPALARFCFAKKHATLEAAGVRLQRLRSRLES